jgi:hypothetical protein
MKRFVIFYEHENYGRYSTNVDGKDILFALKYFAEHHRHKAIYGIMEVS